MTRGIGLRLLGGFDLRRDDRVVEVPVAAHRLLGFLALHDRRLTRAYVADTLWPDTDEEKAHANLRTALWRLKRPGRDVLVVTAGELGLDESVAVDVRTLHQAAREHRRRGTLPDPELLLDLRGELLPGCWDAWVVFDRERLRQEAVQLFEAAARAALAREERSLALLLGLGAVECDPLRESANVLAVRVRLASGDVVGAVNHARSYARLLDEEIGVGPPSLLADLLWTYRGQKAATVPASAPVMASG